MPQHAHRVLTVRAEAQRTLASRQDVRNYTASCTPLWQRGLIPFQGLAVSLALRGFAPVKPGRSRLQPGGTKPDDLTGRPPQGAALQRQRCSCSISAAGTFANCNL